MGGRSVALLDTETATRSPMSACSIGWALLRCDDASGEGGWFVSDAGQVFIRPPRNLYGSKNVEIHGISPAVTSDAQSFAEAWRGTVRPLLLEAEVDCLVAWNASFDAPVLWCSLIGSLHAKSPHDAQSAARALLRGSDGGLWRIGCAMRACAQALPSDGKISLKAFTDRVGVVHDDEHDAAADCRAAGQVVCIAANRTARSPAEMCDAVHGGWWQFGRTGPQPVPPYTANLKPAGVLRGVQRDGRLLRTVDNRPDPA